jgi:hypothetical protein
LGLLALALASPGCDSGRKNPPDATVRVLNVAPSFVSLDYRREEVVATNLPTTLGYQQGSSDLNYDEDTYDFHVSSVDPSTVTRVDRDSFSQKVETGTLYTFVFLESGGNVTHTILESPRLASNATNAQIQATHASEVLRRVDLYLEAPGTDITGATPWGTIGFTESLAAREVPAGTYELAVTEAGNPANVLFTTPAFSLDPLSSTTLALSPDGGEGIAPLNVVLLNGAGATTLIDPSFPALIRALNGATDQAPRDVAFNSQFTPPLFSAAAFGTPTTYEPLTAAESIPVNVTPVGNPGVLELTGSVTLIPTKMYTTFFTGDAGALSLSYQPDDRRKLAGLAKITLYSATTSGAPELLILAPGTDPTTVASSQTPTFVTPAGVQPITVLPGTYEVWLRTYLTTTIVGGPVTVTVAEKGFYGIVFSNNANGTTIDMSLIDDFL